MSRAFTPTWNGMLIPFAPCRDAPNRSFTSYRYRWFTGSKPRA